MKSLAFCTLLIIIFYRLISFTFICLIRSFIINNVKNNANFTATKTLSNILLMKLMNVCFEIVFVLDSSENLQPFKVLSWFQFFVL